jgi:hypothetical protein
VVLAENSPQATKDYRRFIERMRQAEADRRRDGPRGF